MDRVGGYLAYRALEEDARAYDEVIIAIRGEVEADRIRRLEAEAKRGAARG